MNREPRYGHAGTISSKDMALLRIPSRQTGRAGSVFSRKAGCLIGSCCRRSETVSGNAPILVFRAPLGERRRRGGEARRSCAPARTSRNVPVTAESPRPQGCRSGGNASLWACGRCPCFPEKLGRRFICGAQTGSVPGQGGEFSPASRHDAEVAPTSSATGAGGGARQSSSLPWRESRDLRFPGRCDRPKPPREMRMPRTACRRSGRGPARYRFGGSSQRRRSESPRLPAFRRSNSERDPDDRRMEEATRDLQAVPGTRNFRSRLRSLPREPLQRIGASDRRRTDQRTGRSPARPVQPTNPVRAHRAPFRPARRHPPP